MKYEAENSLNAICPYFTMFPLEYPEKVIAEHHISGSAILDPFCGRGTSLFAARKKDIYSIGIDSSPVAVAAARAKLINTTPDKIIRVARGIINAKTTPLVPSGDFWEYAYSPTTLLSICKLRESLLKDCSSSERQALRAIVLGALHGPLSKAGTSYFSNQCPRTYSPKPNYSVKYWKDHELMPPSVDVLSVITTRAYRYFSQTKTIGSGFVLHGDSRNKNTYAKITSRLETTDKEVGLIISSPPYYGMRTYIPDQWLRNWFVGGPPTVDYDASGQISHNGVDTFAKELRKVWTRCSELVIPNGVLAIRFGAINDRAVDPEEIIRLSLERTHWNILNIQKAGIPSKEKRQANSFSSNNPPKDQIEEIDIIAVINKRKSNILNKK